MESRLIINQFDELDIALQQEIQDFISGETTNWSIELFTHCDGCGKETELKRLESDGGVIRVCRDCELSINKNIQELRNGK